MSYTGHYVYDETLRKLVKVSETTSIPSALGHSSCWFPKTGKYFDTMAQRTFHDKSEKRAWMKAKGIREIDAGPNPLRGLAESRDCRQRKHFNV